MTSLINRRQACVSVMAAAMASGTRAQSYATRPLRMVIPFAAGGPLDTLGRALAHRLGLILGQNVIVDNRSGGGTIIGVDAVAKSQGDGHTLLLVGSGMRFSLPHMAKLPFDPVADLTAVARVADAPQVFFASLQSGLKSLSDVQGAARQGRKLNLGLVGGALPQMTGQLFAREAGGIELVEVPYRGGGPAMLALAAGQVDLLVADLGAGLAQWQARQIRALAVTSPRRIAELPDVPTTIESGFPAVVAANVYGIFVPATTPKAIVDQLNQAINTALTSPDVRDHFTRAGVIAGDGSSRQYEEFLVEQTAKWGPMAKALGTRVN